MDPFLEHILDEFYDQAVQEDAVPWNDSAGPQEDDDADHPE